MAVGAKCGKWLETEGNGIEGFESIRLGRDGHDVEIHGGLRATWVVDGALILFIFFRREEMYTIKFLSGSTTYGISGKDRLLRGCLESSDS